MTTSLLIAAACLIALWVAIAWLARRVRIALSDWRLHKELYAEFNQMESDLTASALEFEFENAKRDFRQALKKQRPPKPKLTTRSISKAQTIPTSQSSTPTIPTSIEPTSIKPPSNPNPKRKRGLSTPPKPITPDQVLNSGRPTSTPIPKVVPNSTPPQQLIRVNPCPSVVEFNHPPKRHIAKLVLVAIFKPIAAISRWCINFFTRPKPPASSFHSDLRKAA